MNIRPLHDRVLAKRLAAENTTCGRLLIPDTAKEKPLEPLVISAGNGRILESGDIQPLSVKAGVKALIGEYSGSEAKLDGKDYIILREADILGRRGPNYPWTRAIRLLRSIWCREEVNVEASTSL